MTGILLICFAVLLMVGCPVGFAIGLSSLITILFQSNFPLIIIPQKMFAGLDKFILLALPFYITVGVVMEQLKLTDEIIKIADAFVGHMKGSLAQVNIVACMIFGGIQGSGSADAAAIGSVLIPSMIKKGYTPAYSCAVTASAAQLAPIIPPSVMMIIYGSITGDSVGEMFLGGIIPGITMGFMMMILAYFYAIKGGQTNPIEHNFSLINLLKILKQNFTILGIPVLIVGGIMGGFFTATEAGVVTVLYAFLIARIFYREKFTLPKIIQIFLKACITTSMVFTIVSAASVFNWILTVEQVPQNVINFIIGLNMPRTAIIISIIIILIIVGMFMDVFASMVMLVPILHPIGQHIGMDPIQYGILIVVALVIGAITPPLGIPLFITVSIAKCPAEDAFRQCFPFAVILAIGTLIVAFVPEYTLLIPRLVGK